MGDVRAHVLTIVMRVAVLVALAASASLLVDYLGVEAAFCSSTGCVGLRRWGYLAGGMLPIPLVGVVAFSTVLVVSLLRKVRGLEALSHSLAATGGIIGVGLIGFQLVVQKICVPCLVTDASAIVAGAAGAWMLFDSVLTRHKIIAASAAAPSAKKDPLPVWAWALLAVFAVGVPTMWAFVKPGAVIPEGIRAHYREGKINVVELSDFECGHCRDLHPRLKHLVEEYGERVNYVRLNTPLSMHERGRIGARAAICAEQQGYGEEMADELFRSDGLEDRDITRLSLTLGLDASAFAACMGDPGTEERIDREIALLRATGQAVTPTVYVGEEVIRGALPELVFRDAFERADRGDARSGVPAPAYFGGAAVLLVGVVLLGMWRGPRSSP